jgi:hypothetical protein
MLDNPDDPLFIDAFNRTGGVSLFWTVDIPELATVRQLYNSWGSVKKQLVKDKLQTSGLAADQFIAELKVRVRREVAFKDFMSIDLDSLVAYVVCLVNTDADIEPKSFMNVKQMHIGDKHWKSAANIKLTLPQKQQFIDALKHVNSTQNFMDSVHPTEATSPQDAEIVELGNANNDVLQLGEIDNDLGEICEEDMYDRFEGSIEEMCGAMADEVCGDGDSDVE